MYYPLVTKRHKYIRADHHHRVVNYSLAKTYLAAMLARKASNIGSSQEDQELSSSGRLGTEPQDFAPRSLVPVRSSSASSPAIIGIIMGLVKMLYSKLISSPKESPYLLQ